MYVSGHSYGASVPSLAMQALRKGRSAFQEQDLRRRSFAMLAPLILTEIHPGNLGPLPPSPRAIVEKAVQVGLVNGSDAVYALLWETL